MSSFVRNLEDRPRGLIKDFIYVKDNSLTKDFCIHVIKKFDEDPRKKDGVVGSEGKRVDKNLKDTVDIPISRTEGWEEEDDIFICFSQRWFERI